MRGPGLAGHSLELDQKRWHVVVGVLPAVWLAMLHGAVLDLPHADVVDALHADRYRIYWLVGSYLFGGATGMAMTGFWASRLGLRRTLLLFVVVFSCASALCATVSSPETMAPWRLIAGYAMGLIISPGMLILWREFPSDEELAMTLYGMGVYLSAISGILLGGVLLYWFTWRALFLVQLPLGAAVAVLSARFLPKDGPPSTPPPPFDLIGLFVFAAWVFTMIIVLAFGHYWGWLDSPIFVPWFVAFVLAVVGFIGWGLLASNPLINLRPLRERNFGLGLAVKALFSINVFVLLAHLSGYMIGMRGYQWWQGGLVISPALLGMGATMLAGAHWGRDPSRKLRIFAGMAVMALVTWRLAAIDLYTSKFWIAGWLGLWGMGAGLAIGPTMLTIFYGLPREMLSHAAGVFNILRTLPVFVVGGLLSIGLTRGADLEFHRLRERITYDRPVVNLTLEAVESHLAARGRPPQVRRAEARAVVAHWVHLNAKVFATGSVLQMLAIITAGSLFLIPLLRPPGAVRHS